VSNGALAFPKESIHRSPDQFLAAVAELPLESTIDADDCPIGRHNQHAVGDGLDRELERLCRVDIPVSHKAILQKGVPGRLLRRVAPFARQRSLHLAYQTEQVSDAAEVA
jgi:hypothetical protein